MANAPYNFDDLETRLAATRNFVQILTDMLETRLAGSGDPKDDNLLFMTYQANAAAAGADQEFHRMLAAQ